MLSSLGAERGYTLGSIPVLLVAAGLLGCSSGGGGGGVFDGGSGNASGSGGNADGGSGTSSGGSGGSSASGGTGGTSGACWEPTLFPIEIQSNGAKTFDWSGIEWDVTPYVCIKANATRNGVTVETPGQKYFFTQAAPTPQYIYNLTFGANFEPYLPDGFDPGEWAWDVEPEPLACTEEAGEADWTHELKWSTAEGVYTIECGQLPFKATGVVEWWTDSP